MGLGGELVRHVFSRSRSTTTRESNARGTVADKRKWTSVRSYLCGDEFNSVLAEEDSGSVKSSVVTVTQPIQERATEKVEILSNEIKEENIPEEKQNSISKVFRREDAAIVIQTAFRNYMTRRHNEKVKLAEDKQELFGLPASPSTESLGTSIEVQTGNSVELPLAPDERGTFNCRIKQKARTQVLKLKEDWDDSTVSSNISKMRMQLRLEAMTRRERALAYAFSQQLRICSKKKQNRSDGTETDMSWSWLERWMATRLPENSLVDDCLSKGAESPNSTKTVLARKRFEDVAWEEKESCGSNDVSVHFDRLAITAREETEGHKSAKNRPKPFKSVSRRKTAPSYHATEYAKVSKKDCPRDIKKDTKNKQEAAGRKKEAKCKSSLA